MNIDNTNINCREQIQLPELLGDGSIYCYDMFKYIYNEFNDKKFLDVNSVFNNGDIYKNNKLKIIIFNYNIYNKDNIIYLNEEISKILKYINVFEKLYIIMPMSVNVKNLNKHAITIIYEFYNKIFNCIYIQNSGNGIELHQLYDSNYVNYVYTILVNYDFNNSAIQNKDLLNTTILTYLLYTFFKKYIYIKDIYYWLSIFCFGSLRNLIKEIYAIINKDIDY